MGVKPIGVDREKNRRANNMVGNKRRPGTIKKEKKKKKKKDGTTQTIKRKTWRV